MAQTSSKDMKVLLLTEDSLTYLLFVYEAHLRTGIPSDEVFAAASLKAQLDKAQTVDLSKLGKAEIEKLSPTGVTLNLTPETPPPDSTVSWEAVDAPSSRIKA